MKTRPKAAKKPAALARADARMLRPLEMDTSGAGPEVLDRLWQTVESRRLAGDIEGSHSARLMARGWVTRHRDPADARLLRVALTPAAEAALPGWVERARAITAATLAPLGPADAARVGALLQRME